MKKTRFLLPLFLMISLSGFAIDEMKLNVHLNWQAPQLVNLDGTDSYFFHFDNAYYTDSPYLPVYQRSVFFQDKNKQYALTEIVNPVFDSVDVRHLLRNSDYELLDYDLIAQASAILQRDDNGVHITLYPFVKDAETGSVFRVVSFGIRIYTHEAQDVSLQLKSDFVSESVLSGGNWYKFAVSETGVYKITYNDLVDAGINPASINPQHIRLYGNGGGMLPERNSEFRHDDLIENAIMVVGEENGVFNQNDYILFYGQSPHDWRYTPNSKIFDYVHNIYEDRNYYFLTTDRGMGKRIALQPSTNIDATDVVEIFNHYIVHEKNNINLIKSGREWFGEVFDAMLTRDFVFDVPNRVTDSVVNISLGLAARSLQASSFTTNINGEIAQTNISAVSIHGTYPLFGRQATLLRNIQIEQENINVRITYNRTSQPSTGWLNYIRMHTMRNLVMHGDQMSYRNLYTVGPERVSEFRLRNAGSNIRIWDVSDPANVMQQQVTNQGNEIRYKLLTDYLREFIAYDPDKTLPVEFVEKVPNQNLHGADVPDMLIVTHPLFLDEANRLAGFHTSFSGLDVLVATTNEVYNEFSSGKQDVAAIRDFARMFYTRSGNGKDFRYLLLFGDASYDYKDRVPKNTNFVPVWISQESLDPIKSYVTDDFFGYLGENEGGIGINIVDIGIGRLPVSTVDQATAMVDKIIHYASNSHATMADWRNVICFVADDEDNNLHIRQAETMAKHLDSTYSAFNLSKIYLDSYQQISVPGGTRYPEANADINRRVQQGALIVNYTGHGGVLGWAHERVLELPDINSWTNYDMMPVFITATCEFAYFDDPAHTSAGELVILNPKGGGIALFTTTRPTYASPNFTINKLIFEYAFTRENHNSLRLGDIMRLAKRDAGSGIDYKKFVLLGDPALKLAVPEYNVVTTQINSTDISIFSDTLKALSLNTIEGVLKDHSGNIMSDFSGTLSPIVYDKPQKITTLANDGGPTFDFTTQQNIIYKGNVSVNNGHFSFSFIVPKDIAYAYDYGKISYYATDGQRDAAGYNRSILVGGFNENAVSDDRGPEIDLYINDENFRFGGITDENPVLFARVRDESGINTTGNGIGHDITAILNHQTSKPIILNDFYSADLDTYQSGTIRYPFFNLPDGRYHVSVKVWDIHNNPADTYTEFVVATSAEIALEQVLNFPNPFTYNTNFVFEHNQAGVDLEVEIYIYSIDGRLRKALYQKIRPQGYRTQPISWDGRDDRGQMLEGGTYVYRVIIRNPATGASEKGNKLVIVR